MKEKQTELLQQAISLDTVGYAGKKADYQKIENLTEFGKMLNPFGFLKGRQKVYARIISEEHPEIRENIQNEERRDGFTVHISLLTEEMLQADYEYFNYEEFANRTDRFLTEEARKNYKPYYYEFTGFVRKSQKREYGMLSESVMDRWFTAWLDRDAVSEEESYYIEGIVEFSASPFKEHRGCFVRDKNSKTVTEEEQKKIDAWKLPDKDNQRLLKEVFLQAFDNARNKFRVKVYDVGQANCIYMQNKRIGKLIVPHHGGRMKTDKLKNIAPGYGEAIISVGKDGEKYKHPNQDHTRELENVNYTVKQTLHNLSLIHI